MAKPSSANPSSSTGSFVSTVSAAVSTALKQRSITDYHKSSKSNSSSPGSKGFAALASSTTTPPLDNELAWPKTARTKTERNEIVHLDGLRNSANDLAPEQDPSRSEEHQMASVASVASITSKGPLSMYVCVFL